MSRRESTHLVQNRCVTCAQHHVIYKVFAASDAAGHSVARPSHRPSGMMRDMYGRMENNTV